MRLIRHNLYDADVFVLKNIAQELILCSNTYGKGVKVIYPDFGYLGIWHMPKTDAPYVCIELCSSLPPGRMWWRICIVRAI